MVELLDANWVIYFKMHLSTKRNIQHNNKLYTSICRKYMAWNFITLSRFAVYQIWANDKLKAI